jgi:hypothetical protein
MGACVLPEDLALGRSRIQAWRERRRVGSRIPRSFWELAIRLAQRHGISRTSTALGLDYYYLKKQTESVTAQAPARQSAFVELPSPLIVGKQCRLEMDNAAGIALRLQLTGYEAAEVALLARGLWNAE